MENILKSNFLKLRHTKIYKFIWLFPLMCSLIAIVFCSLGGEETTPLTAETIVNQWAVLWINITIAVFTGLLDKLEKDSNRYMIYLSRNLNLQKIELYRGVFIGSLLLISSLVLMSILTITSLIFKTPSVTSLFRIYVAVLLIWLCSLWQIPFTLWLSRKTNIYTSVVLNTLLPLLFGTSISLTSHWFLFPYDWSMRLLAPLTNMQINGIPTGAPFSSLMFIALAIPAVLSVLFLLLCSLLAGVSFERQVR
ncbi:lantibiotic immunity ABC transporter MutE/EpiE family permease subunit [Streptococcus gallolyticus]|uniref:Lantibiotic ABC transporter n=1 Tax=Streptococcus gallolyticus TaxID=315405 RepID=A0A139QVY9_9STRE|nr:lantibiotic immunity ABC transporter MutE/EpiE family permease subunit [Streptococcus gallolyticus]KXT74005.1 Lantibiotic ABC transporter [Streptococcus gallolyticus]KXU06689.1 Lantibiotic ABC transporter [Streptococcus gallolyticus]